jgi:G2/mitotic-specific cyclin 3/4
MLAVGGLKAAAKRTAFGDVSNTVKNLATTRDDSVVNCKQINIEFVKPLIAQEKPAAFLRPAQRPLNNNTVKAVQNASGTTTADPPVTSSSLKVETKQQAPALKRTQSKKLPPIFKDSDVEEQPHAVNVSARPESATLPSVHQNLGLQHQPSLPQINQDLPQLRRTESKLIAPLIVDPVDKQLPAEPKLEDARAHPQGLEGKEAQSNTIEPQKTAPLVPAEEYETYIDNIIGNSEKSWLQEKDSDKIDVQQRQLPAPPLVSEPEEYWEDEEEEVYDEQGYTTAHSYRSRGDNTTGGATTVLFPKVTNKVKQELAAAKELVDSQRTQEEIEDEAWDTSMVAEYGDEIFSYMRELEVRSIVMA